MKYPTITVNPEIGKDLDHFYGKPTVVSFEITDENNEKYESDVHLESGWSQKMLSDAIAKSFLLCDATPTAVYIKWIGPDRTIMN